jgi:hypothetical protein
MQNALRLCSAPHAAARAACKTVRPVMQKVHGTMEQNLLGSSALQAAHPRVRQALSIKETP